MDMPGAPVSLPSPHPAASAAAAGEFVTFAVHGQWFCIPVAKVHATVIAERIAPIPLAPPAVQGAFNLHGRVVTVIDPRVCLALPAEPGAEAAMAVTVDHQGHLYALLADRVGEVVPLPADRWETSPATLDPGWREIADGVCQHAGRLVVRLDVDRLIGRAGRR
jgi:purine-binding chemotaxis protein CheW